MTKFQKEIFEKLGAEKLAEVLATEAELKESGYYEDDLLLVDCTASQRKAMKFSKKAISPVAENEEEYEDDEDELFEERFKNIIREEEEKREEEDEEYMFNLLYVW